MMGFSGRIGAEKDQGESVTQQSNCDHFLGRTINGEYFAKLLVQRRFEEKRPQLMKNMIFLQNKERVHKGIVAMAKFKEFPVFRIAEIARRNANWPSQ